MIEKRTATEPGALDAYVWTCGRCGLELAYSLESMTTIEAREHVAYHARDDRRVTRPTKREIEALRAWARAER